MPSPRVLADMLGLPFWVEGDRVFRFDKGKRGIRDVGWTPAPEALASYRRATAEELELWTALWDDSTAGALWVRAACAKWPSQFGRALSAAECAFCRDQGWLQGWETNGWAHIVDAEETLLCKRALPVRQRAAAAVSGLSPIWFADRHWGLPRGDGHVVAQDSHVSCDACLRVLQQRMQPAAPQPLTEVAP